MYLGRGPRADCQAHEIEMKLVVRFCGIFLSYKNQTKGSAGLRELRLPKINLSAISQ